MGIVPFLLLVAAADAPGLEISTLKGDTHKGQLQQLTASVLKLKTPDGQTEVSVRELLEVRFQTAARPDKGELAQVVLVDGSRIGCAKIAAASEKVMLESPLIGSLTIPQASVASIRFSASDARVRNAWHELCERTLKKDLLVVRKKRDEGDILDHLSGVVGDVNDQTIKFLLGEDEIPVKRGNVFGIVYRTRESPAGKPACVVRLVGSDVIQANAVASDGKQLRVTLAAGAEVSIPIDKLKSLDFSQGKVLYLSQVEPREVKFTPLFDYIPGLFDYRRDRNLSDGGPLQLGTTTYSRGLAIHSKTYLRYRIGKEYRRFQAVMGIDKAVAHKGGDVHVVISGDGKKLLEADVRGVDKPSPVDLDVSGVLNLEILVDFGGDLDIADHLDLADARVIK